MQQWTVRPDQWSAVATMTGDTRPLPSRGWVHMAHDQTLGTGPPPVDGTDLRGLTEQGEPAERNALCPCGSGQKAKRCPHAYTLPELAMDVLLYTPDEQGITAYGQAREHMRMSDDEPSGFGRVCCRLRGPGVVLGTAVADIFTPEIREQMIDSLIGALVGAIAQSAPWLRQSEIILHAYEPNALPEPVA